MRRVRGCALALLCPALWGCASAEYEAPSLEEARRWTLLVVRAAPDVGPEEQALVERAARDAMARTGLLLPLPPGRAGPLEQDAGAWAEMPPPRLLVEASRGQGADAVGVLGVRRFDPYPPARVELTLEVHSTETGALLYAHSVALEGSGALSRLALGPDALANAALRGDCPRRPARHLSRFALAREACDALLAPVGD